MIAALKFVRGYVLFLFALVLIAPFSAALFFALLVVYKWILP